MAERGDSAYYSARTALQTDLIRATMPTVPVTDTTFPARDGFSLAATVFSPPEPRAIVLVSSATAVPRKIYRGFASFLAEQGFAALTYDYRGTGESRPASLKGFSARMRDWAAQDVAGAIDHARRMWPDLKLNYVGHSFGGQAVGLIPNSTEISRALLVASQSGYWRYYVGFEKYRVWTMFRTLMPLLAHIAGYVPGSKIGLGEDLPNGVFFEWRDWCMSPNFFFDDATLTATANYPKYTSPMRAIGLNDDPWATAPAIDALVKHFTGTKVERIQIAPRDIGAAKIGHFGFFRPEHRDTLWRDAAEWLRS
jgi:predicted alpha/beta hydrolase